MRALIIGQKQREQIAELRAVAAANIFDLRSVQRTADKDVNAFRDMMTTLTIILPVGYCVTYSHENQSAGVAAHVSISVDRPRKMPSPEAVEMILTEFGMAPIRQSDGVWIEDIDDATKAINIVQLLETPNV